MAITINGTGSITGLTAGGLPDGSITTDDLAANAVTAAKLAAGAGGKILQVQSVYHTSATQLASSGALHELTTSLRISFTPVSASSTLYLECFGSFIFRNSGHLQYAAFYNVTSSDYVNLPPASGSRARVHWINRTRPYDGNDANFMYLTASVAAANTTARTYTVYHGTEGEIAEFLASGLSTVAGATYPLVFKITEVAA